MRIRLNKSIRKYFGPERTDLERFRLRSVISFSVLVVFLLSCAGLISWIYNQPRDAGAFAPLRKVLDANEKIFSKIYSTEKHAKTFTVENAVPAARVNGRVGLSGEMDRTSWHLDLLRAEGDTLKITMDDIRALPKSDLIFNFKCIEGWSEIIYCSGVRFSVFMDAFGLHSELYNAYVGMVTPDGKYYVGNDMESMLHPQTILCYEMSGEALSDEQGAPLRLIIPVKYGVKHLKCIGSIFFSDSRPPDYWYERGYDYYCGL